MKVAGLWIIRQQGSNMPVRETSGFDRDQLEVITNEVDSHDQSKKPKRKIDLISILLSLGPKRSTCEEKLLLSREPLTVNL